MHCDCIATSYRERRAQNAQNAEKVSKRSSRACRPGVPKKCRKSRKSHEKVPKRDFFVTFSEFFRHLFGTFLALRADRPATTFLRLFRHFGHFGPGTPCNWSLQSQPMNVLRQDHVIDGVSHPPSQVMHDGWLCSYSEVIQEPLPLKPRIFHEKSLVLVKCKIWIY